MPKAESLLPLVMDNATSAAAGASFPASMSNLTTRQIATYTLVFLLAYPILVSALRFHRLGRLHERYSKYATREGMAQMTDDDAFQIQKEMIQLEFPFFYLKALQFALFRVPTYPSQSLSIPSRIHANLPDIRHPHHLPNPNKHSPIL